MYEFIALAYLAFTAWLVPVLVYRQGKRKGLRRPLLAATATAVLATLGPFAVDLPNILNTKYACSQLPPYEVFKPVGTARTRTEQRVKHHGAYEDWTFDEVDVIDNTLYSRFHILKAKGVGPFAGLINSRLSAFHPFASATTCPFTPAHWQPYRKELRRL